MKRLSFHHKNELLTGEFEDVPIATIKTLPHKQKKIVAKGLYTDENDKLITVYVAFNKNFFERA